MSLGLGLSGLEMGMGSVLCEGDMEGNENGGCDA